MNDLLQDISFAWRNALKKPATSLLIVLTLALGIGANTAMFSIAYKVLLAPLPYANGEQLVKLEQQIPGKDRVDAFWAQPTFQDLRAASDVLEEVAGYQQGSLPVQISGEPVAALVGVVSANYFGMLGVQPVLGRDFAAADEVIGSQPVALLAHEFWVENGGDSDLVGSTMEVGGMVFSVIGVLPALPAYPSVNHLWITKAGDPYTVKRPDDSGNRDGYWFDQAFGKVRAGLEPETVAVELAALSQRLATEYPDVYMDNYEITTQSLKEEMTGDAATTFVLLQTMALLVLVVASFNVANLNLARASERHQELAIREAVGANRLTLGRQLVTDSLLHGLAGGALGLLFAYAGLNLLKDFAVQFTPLAGEATLDGFTLAFGLGLSLLAGVLGGLAPAFMPRDINRALKEGGSQTTAAASGMRRRRALLVFQLAFSFVIITSAGLIMLSLQRLNTQDPGYDPEGVLALSMIFMVDLDRESQLYAGQIGAFTEQLVTRVSALPGVVQAGLYGGRPLLDSSVYNSRREAFIVDEGAGAPTADVFAQVSIASGDYFGAVGIPLLQGRLFTGADIRGGEEVAIVNASFAASYFPGGEVLGQRIRMPWQADWTRIVGVVGNVRSGTLDREEGELVYWNYAQHPADVLSMYVKTAGRNYPELERQIRDIVQQLAPGQALSGLRPLEDIRRGSLAPQRLRAALMLVAGFVALLVTLSGVIGIVVCNVNIRLREIGVRMALGAQPADIMRMFMANGLLLCACGILLGLGLMLLAAIPLLEPLLYETSPTNLAIYLGSAFALSLAVLAATWLPVRKTSAMQAMGALHGE